MSKGKSKGNNMNKNKKRKAIMTNWVRFADDLKVQMTSLNEYNLFKTIEDLLYGYVAGHELVQVVKVGWETELYFDSGKVKSLFKNCVIELSSSERGKRGESSERGESACESDERGESACELVNVYKIAGQFVEEFLKVLDSVTVLSEVTI